MKKGKRKRILFMLGWYYPDSVGGTEAYVHMLCEDIKKMGWEPCVMAPSQNGKEARYEYGGVQVYRYALPSDPLKHELRGDVRPREFECFARQINEIAPDIVNMNTYNWACGGYHARHIKSLGIPLVLTIHVPEVHCSRGTMMKWGAVRCDGRMIVKRCTACVINKYGVSRTVSRLLSNTPSFIAGAAESYGGRLATALSMRNIIESRFEKVRALFNTVDHIVTVSEWLREVLISNGVQGEKITSILKGLPDDWLGLGDEIGARNGGDKLRLAYIGRMSEVKGVHVLIQSVKRLGDGANLELQIYGRINDAESEEYCQSLVEMARGCDSVKFMGELTEANRLQAYSNIDMIVCPSTGFENLPYVVSEAFAARIPVLASDVNGLDEQIRHGVNGILAEPGSVESMSAAIQKILDDPDTVKRLRDGIPRVRRNFDSSRETAELFHRVIQDYSH